MALAGAMFPRGVGGNPKRTVYQPRLLAMSFLFAAVANKTIWPVGGANIGIRNDQAFAAFPSLSAVTPQRTGRPLADVRENLHDDALPASNERRDRFDGNGRHQNNRGEDSSDDVDMPEFMTNSFLQKAYSIEPSIQQPTAEQHDSANPNHWINFVEHFDHRNLPIHEADLKVPKRIVIGREPSTTTTKQSSNLNDKLKIFPLNANKQYLPSLQRFGGSQNDTKENITRNASRSSTPKSSQSFFGPNIFPVSLSDSAQNQHCSWLMLNTFLLVWSILSTAHWIWFCSSKLCRFMHQMEVSKANKQGPHQRNTNASRMLQQWTKMMEQRQRMGRVAAATKTDGNSNRKMLLLNGNGNKQSSPQLLPLNSSSSASCSSLDGISRRRKSHRGSCTPRARQQRLLHRTLISIPAREQQQQNVLLPARINNLRRKYAAILGQQKASKNGEQNYWQRQNSGESRLSCYGEESVPTRHYEDPVKLWKI